MAWQCLFTILFRVALSCFPLSGRSLAVTVVMHGAYNAAWALYPVEGSHYSLMFTAGLTAVVAAVLALCTRTQPVRQPA